MLRIVRHHPVMALAALCAVSLFLGATPLFAEDGDGPIAFSDGSDRSLGLAIPETLDEAARLGEAWKESLDIQGPEDFGHDIDVDAMRTRALNNPRVRALLNADDAALQQAGADQVRYQDQYAFLFASFSMPPASLKTMLREGEALGVPVIFRGFVENSVFETQIAMEAVFGDEEDISGFTIDPTMFARFDVTVVPTLIVVADPIQPCATSGCEGDAAPVHDRLAGNIPLRAALEIVVRGGGDAAASADNRLPNWDEDQ